MSTMHAAEAEAFHPQAEGGCILPARKTGSTFFYTLLSTAFLLYFVGIGFNVSDKLLIKLDVSRS